MNDLSNHIANAVAAKLTPDFIEKEIDARIEKLVREAVDSALRTYSDTGKLIQQAVSESLRVDRLDLPTYGQMVSGMLKRQIETLVAPLIEGQLAADMAELLNLAPSQIKLSAIADDMRKEHEGNGYGPVITVIVEQNDYGSTWIYLDNLAVYKRTDKYRCRIRLLVDSDGKIASATVDEKDLKSTKQIGRAYGLEQQIRSWVACGTTLIIDEGDVCTSVGDY